MKTVLKCKEPIYDFDWTSIILVMKKQMEHVYEACFVNGHHVVKQKEKRTLEICIDLCDRILNFDKYKHGYLAPYIDWDTEIYITKKVRGKDLYQMIPIPEKDLPRLSYGSKTVKSTFDLQDKVWQHHLDLLFKLMRRNIQKWWD